MIEQKDNDELTAAYLAGCHDTKKAYEQRLAAAEAKIPRWIPVTERLPKPGATVLAVDNSVDMGVCTFVNARFVGECFGFEAYLNDGGWDCSPSKVNGEYVTHWMPLPDKPVNKSEEGVMNVTPENTDTIIKNMRSEGSQSRADYLELMSQRLAETEQRLAAANGRLEEYEEKTCNCRWEGDTLVRQCELHKAQVDAIHEWAERAKVAEQRLWKLGLRN